MAAIDYSAKYVIVGPDGTTVSFNDDTDENFCGYLTTITGLDCAEVRENAQNKVAGSGGLHDNFYAGRLPWSFSGMIQPSVLTNAKQELIQAAVNKAKAIDGKLLWYPSNGQTGIERMVAFRCQQPTRMSGTIPKTFQISAVGADYRILSSAINVAGPTAGHTPLSVTATNQGNEVSDVRFVINGPFNADKLIIVNETSGKQIQFLPGVIGYPSGTGVLPGGDDVNVNKFYISTNYATFDDYDQYTCYLSDGNGDARDQYPYVDPLNTDWSIGVEPGANVFTMHADGSTTDTSFEVQWRHSWI